MIIEMTRMTVNDWAKITRSRFNVFTTSLIVIEKTVKKLILKSMNIFIYSSISDNYFYT